MATPGLGVDESETISRTLLLAQRTADTTVAEAQAEADRLLAAARDDAGASLDAAREDVAQLIEEAKADARRAGESERVQVEGEVQALLARRDFLESDVDHLEQYLVAQRERIVEAAAALNDLVQRVPGGLADMRRPLLSAAADSVRRGLARRRRRRQRRRRGARASRRRHRRRRAGGRGRRRRRADARDRGRRAGRDEDDEIAEITRIAGAARPTRHDTVRTLFERPSSSTATQPPGVGGALTSPASLECLAAPAARRDRPSMLARTPTVTAAGGCVPAARPTRRVGWVGNGDDEAITSEPSEERAG